MNKLQKFYERLDAQNLGTEANNGDFGYFVTVGELLDNGGSNEFFRTSKVIKGVRRVSRSVYWGLEYDKQEKAWYAGDYNDICHYSPSLSRSDVVFIGFDY